MNDLLVFIAALVAIAITILIIVLVMLPIGILLGTITGIRVAAYNFRNVLIEAHKTLSK